MEKVEKAAKTANGRIRMCAKCPFNTKPKSRCTEEIYTLCSTSFVTGFRKGANWRKMENKKVKIALPKNCEVEKIETSVEDKFIIAEYTPRMKEFKNGDIVYMRDVYDYCWISIFGREENGDIHNHCGICLGTSRFRFDTPRFSIFGREENGDIHNHCGICLGASRFRFDTPRFSTSENKDQCFTNRDTIKEIRLATERERETLFDALKEKGLQWNKKEKRIEKIRWRA